jgi:hypothetical protein
MSGHLPRLYSGYLPNNRRFVLYNRATLRCLFAGTIAIWDWSGALASGAKQPYLTFVLLF